MGGSQTRDVQSWFDGKRSLPRERDKMRFLVQETKSRRGEMPHSKVKKKKKIVL